MKYHIGKGTSNNVEQCVDEASKEMQCPKLIIFFHLYSISKNMFRKFTKDFQIALVWGQQAFQ